ncbi:sugar phosphate nucleotidyltransferase [Bradyrhizobium sp. UFLA05-109]
MSRAVILAGGRGTRLHPFTMSLPKPLVPIVDQPILEIIIRQLAVQGFEHITLAVNHQAELLKAYFGDGSRWNVKVDYSLEVEPLGTMGPLRLISDLPDNFVLMNGDILSDINFGALLAGHVSKHQLMTIATSAREQHIDFGVLEVSDGHIRGFHEKPSIPYNVSLGVYCLSRRILPEIPPSQSFGFDQLVLKMLAAGKPLRAEFHPGYWLDIGRPDDYQKAIEEWPALKAKLGL